MYSHILSLLNKTTFFSLYVIVSISQYMRNNCTLKLGLEQSRAQCCQIITGTGSGSWFSVWLHTDCAKHVLKWREREGSPSKD